MMPQPEPGAGRRYLDRLTDGDRRLLASVSRDGELRPQRLPDLLARDEVFQAVFPRSGRGRPEQPLLVASPFLAFAVAVQRTAADLSARAYVAEWTGPRQRVPVFDSGELVAFLAEPWHGLFLSELLASYAHVASGSYWTRTGRGWRRRRWNELDPARLAGLLEAVPQAERAGVYRRLGDLALFLTGVFPDHTAAHGLHPVEVSRLLTAAGAGREAREQDVSPLTLLERLGGRWYRLAADRAVTPTADSRLVAEVAQRFRSARRVLNVVSERYLFPAGNPWFPAPSVPAG